MVLTSITDVTAPAKSMVLDQPVPMTDDYDTRSVGSQ